MEERISADASEEENEEAPIKWIEEEAGPSRGRVFTMAKKTAKLYHGPKGGYEGIQQERRRKMQRDSGKEPESDEEARRREGRISRVSTFDKGKARDFTG